MGVLLFEMVTGRMPFAGDSDYEIMKSKVENVPLSPKEFNDKIPDNVNEILSRALAKDPEERYASSEAFLKALDESDIDTNSASSTLNEFISTHQIAAKKPITPLTATADIILSREPKKNRSSGNLKRKTPAEFSKPHKKLLSMLAQNTWLGPVILCFSVASIAGLLFYSKPTELDMMSSRDILPANVGDRKKKSAEKEYNKPDVEPRKKQTGSSNAGAGLHKELKPGKQPSQKVSNNRYSQPEMDKGKPSKTNRGSPKVETATATSSPVPAKEIIAKKESHPVEFVKYSEQLRSDNSEIKRKAARIICRKRIYNSRIVAIANDELLKSFRRNTNNRRHIDAMAWLCNVLGGSQNKKYIATLQQVKEQSKNKKLRKFAIKNLKKLSR
jgi:serine/threonine protein kinase